ncbi:2-polyprenyl-6-methoxyphenol hydroxylase-like FAD-dependent oxidoreductase [Kribbella aluminosa]|uniref:2-polyprenyl-6-methoxyphenol hydroxylase-like FAD-dependent oxidoreductase n=1 Tax=Kribbella aluminosa TaxID=416017 RepID=A0ABS4UJ85_9ACTN|nr:FAD-dependent monooxygenase [Kribbella aluminosa]MBP2351664.1 2-polyprenyl-6-methoxyphenol hydroxylase-like FAD-dependent oxidoreductase [Kribbella aluminosa]
MANSDGGEGRALVVGLGISGIATALRLLQVGWTPVIVERAPARRTGGYFVALFGGGRPPAERLGILERLDNRLPRGASYEIDRAGNRKVGLGYGDLPGSPWMMLRGDIEEAAFSALPSGVDIRHSTVPTRIEQDATGVDVTLANTVDGTTATERFDLVIGADGLRSTVRSLVFGPHERYLHRLNYMAVAYQLPRPLSDLHPDDAAVLLEPKRSMWIFPFAGSDPTVLLNYHTRDVDAEFTQPPVERVRAAFGPEPAGRSLGEVLDALETADDLLFDSVEQVHLDTWHRGRVVLVGDSAWCVTLYAGMGVSTAMSGADLLGTMLQRHPQDVPHALAEWERALRPALEVFQRNGIQQRTFFVPATTSELAVRKLMTAGMRVPVVSSLLQQLRTRDKAGRLKDHDIALA